MNKVLGTALFSCLAIAMANFATVSSAHAEEQQPKPKEYKTKKTPTLNLKLHEKLQKAQELSQEKNDVAGAIKILDDERAKCDKKGCNSYEVAMIWNFYAFIYYSKEDYKNTIIAYEKVLEQPDLPEALSVGTLYSLAQIYFVQENYSKAITTLKKWFSLTQTPGASAWVLLGQLHYQAQEFDEGIAAVEKAVAINRSKQKPVKENWYLLLRAMYYEKEDYQKTFEILQRLVAEYPKRTYYGQLSSMYFQLKKDFEQYSTLAAMNDADMLVKGNEVVSYASLLLANDRPWRAGLILEAGIKEKLVEETENNLRLLASAWMLSKEDKKAIPVLAKAAKKSDTGDIYASLAITYLNLEDWKNAEKSIRSAFKKGKLKRPDQAYINLGMALFNQKKYNEALKAFKNAKKDERSRATAIQWERYTIGERDREAKLKEAV